MSEQNNNNMSGKDFVIGAFVGGIIGACAALLLAPKSGRELRDDLSVGYQTASKKTQEIAKNVGEQTEVIVGKVKEVAEHVKEDVHTWTKGAASTTKEVIEEAEQAVQYVKDEVAVGLDKITEDQSENKSEDKQ